MKRVFSDFDNGEAMPRDRVPHLDFDSFRRQAMEIVSAAARWCSISPTRKTGHSSCWPCCVPITLLVAGCDAPESVPSIGCRV
jgi:hypothetical protein